MTFKKYGDAFEVRKDEDGRKDELGDRHYSYTIYSKLPEETVKEFCLNNLLPINENPFYSVSLFKKYKHLPDSERKEDFYIFSVKKDKTS